MYIVTQGVYDAQNKPCFIGSIHPEQDVHNSIVDAIARAKVLSDDFRKSNTSMRMELPPNEMTIRFYGGTTERHWEIRINEIELQNEQLYNNSHRRKSVAAN